MVLFFFKMHRIPHKGETAIIIQTKVSRGVFELNLRNKSKRNYRCVTHDLPVDSDTSIDDIYLLSTIYMPGYFTLSKYDSHHSGSSSPYKFMSILDITDASAEIVVLNHAIQYENIGCFECTANVTHISWKRECIRRILSKVSLEKKGRVLKIDNQNDYPILFVFTQDRVCGDTDRTVIDVLERNIFGEFDVATPNKRVKITVSKPTYFSLILGGELQENNCYANIPVADLQDLLTK